MRSQTKTRSSMSHDLFRMKDFRMKDMSPGSGDVQMAYRYVHGLESGNELVV